jgi:hypothetical protein
MSVRIPSRLARLLVALWLALVTVPAPPLAAAAAARATASTAAITLPRKAGSVRFAVIGDVGRDARGQYDVAAQMAAVHGAFPFEFVLMLGDNIYGADSALDMANKFTTPYKALLDAGIVFHACLGNHDNPNQRLYAPFHMGGERYSTFRSAPDASVSPTGGAVLFAALDSGYLDRPQLDWLEQQLAAAGPGWKIVFFHHPIYSSGRTHGSALESRAVLEPLFVRYGVSAAFSGHDHVYERTKPQNGGIVYWVSGGGGSLRKGDIRPGTGLTAKGFDTDYHFMVVEIAGDDLHYQAISRTGATIDSGVLHRPGALAVAAAP